MPEKKKTARKRATKKKAAARPSLKTLNIGICLSGDPFFKYGGEYEWTDERDLFIKNYFKEKAKGITELQMSQISADEVYPYATVDVLISHIPPGPDKYFRELCGDWQEAEIIDTETYLFLEYADSLCRLSKLSAVDIPVIGYTKACEEAVELFRKTGLFHAVVEKTGYFKKDCEELKKQILSATKARNKK